MKQGLAKQDISGEQENNLLERGSPINRGPQFPSTWHLCVVTLVFLPKRRLQPFFFLPGSLAVDVAAGSTQTANQEAAGALKARLEPARSPASAC